MIFTASEQSYADAVIDSIDDEHLVYDRLYRYDLTWDGGRIYKDISKRTKDLSRCLIVDDTARHIKQTDNHIHIVPFNGDLAQDKALERLSAFLMQEARSGDLRLAARKYQAMRSVREVAGGSTNKL